MKNLFFKIINFLLLPKSRIFRNNLLVVGGTNAYSLSQFIYHFLAGRYLSRAAYGDLVAIISLMGFVSVVQTAFSLTVVHKIATDKDKKDVANFIHWVNYWSIWIGVILAVLVVIFGPIFINFTNLTQPNLYYFLAPILLGVVIVGFGRSVLLGLMSFDKYVYSLLAEASFKIIFTLALLLAGLATFGALTGFLLGIICVFLVNQFLLSGFLKGSRGVMPQLNDLLRYSSATLLQGITLTSIYSVDLLLVKHFFNSSEAGLYAAIAILGRIVFFCPAPIIHVMFPEISKRHGRGESTNRILFLSLLGVIALASLITLFYFIDPSLPILVLYGEKYLSGSSLLGWYGIFMTFLVVAMLLTQYYLSIRKVKVIILSVFAPILQIILISMFHQDLLSVIKSSILATALLDVLLLIYFFYQKRLQ